VYTADASERNRFRSTGSHATLMIDRAEQNPLSSDYLFALPDRTQAETLRWEAMARGGVWSGRHSGYRGLAEPATHTRTIELDGDASELRIEDVVESDGCHELVWSFPLSPGAETQTLDSGVHATWPSGATLTIEAPGCTTTVEPAAVSPAYGVKHLSHTVRLVRSSSPGADRQRIVLSYGPPR
jgi:hypothetical protein